MLRNRKRNCYYYCCSFYNIKITSDTSLAFKTITKHDVNATSEKIFCDKYKLKE